MKFLIRLLDLFSNNEGRDESRVYSVVDQFSSTIAELAKHKGRSEQDILVELTQTGQEQLRTHQEMVGTWNNLTTREQEVVALICLGQKNYEIARILVISDNTVKFHLNNIFKKFKLRDRKAIRLALKEWDFETWWKNHHRWAADVNANSTSE